LLQGLILVVLLYLIHLWQTRELVTGLAPPLEGVTLDGEHFELADAAREVPRVVHFWATWCPVCRLELDNIAELLPEHTLISVAMVSGSEQEIRQFLDAEGLRLPVIADPQGRLAHRWGVGGVPTTFILDRENNIRFVEVGYTTGLGLRARLWWSAR
jgi:peroxiredoxin